MGNIESFIKEYRFALLQKIIFDKDFKFTLLYKDNIFNYEKEYAFSNNKAKIEEKKILTQKDLNEYIRYPDWSYIKSYLTENYIITENLIDSVKDTQSIF